MKRINEKYISDIIENIYETVENPEKWRLLLEKLCTLLPGAKAAISYRSLLNLQIIKNNELVPYMYHANIDTSFSKKYMEYYKDIDFLNILKNEGNSQDFLKKFNTEFTLISDYVPQKIISNSIYYNDFSKKFEIQDCLALNLFQYSGYYGNLVFLINKSQYIDRQSLQTLNRLAKHLQRAANWGIFKNKHFFTLFKREAITSQLEMQYGLTPEEARVAIAYSQTGDRQKICDDLNKSMNTLKSHQKNIYQKMNLTHTYRKRNQLIEIIANMIDYDDY